MVDIINGPDNLVFFTDVAEKLKPALVTEFVASVNSTAEITSAIQFLAMVDYLSKTKTQSLAIAAKLDSALKKALVDQDGNPIPLAGSVSTAWSKFLDFAQAGKALTETAAQARIKN